MKILECALLILLMATLSCKLEMPKDVATAYESLPDEIDYNFHVKPILSDRCYQCHGPDENTVEADFRLDTEEHAFASLSSGGRGFSPGKPGKSKVIHRILSDDPDFVMPEPSSKLRLSSEEKATIVKWVEQGAKWKPHWSFISPERPEIPKDFPTEWTVNNTIDNFVFSRINKEGLQPSETADKERLLRRVSMDLTGLPPTIEEMDTFLNDESLDAYEKVVDDLLESKHFGERLALDWMDLARYADSHGMHADGWRMMWPWRDWVINAFNENMPYDDFVTWQLAGDLLPNASKEQILATAFHRNHTMTAEGGVVDEEFRLEYVADRTNTTATAFLGLTVECARCHDHKFDPISQEEHFMMQAFFNNVKELGMTGDDGNYGPVLLLTDPEEEQKLTALKKEIREKQAEIQRSEEELIKVKDYIQKINIPNKPTAQIAHFPFEYGRRSKNKKGKEITVYDGNKQSFSNNKPEISPGKVGNGISFSGSGYDEIYLKDVGLFELYDPYSAAAWIRTTQTDSARTQVVMGTAGNKNNFWRGWDIYLDESNLLSFRLIHSLPHNYIHVTSVHPIPVNEWTHIAFTYNGTAQAGGVQLYVNGEQIETITRYNHLYKSILPVKSGNHELDSRPVMVGKSGRAFTGENGIFNGQIDEVRFFDRALSGFEMGLVAGKVDPPGEELLVNYSIGQDKEHLKKLSELRELYKKQLGILENIPEIMVMEEMSEPRPTFLLSRGMYDSPLKQVNMGTPESIFPFPENIPKNRLGLAHWIFHDKNPLTARVTVNRYWHLIFGQGLVNTLNDFGSQGALPTHPELLDWLAIEFRESGWDIKQLIKTIVMSHTYRQKSAVTEVLQEADPENILLARSPSYRLAAEMIRDNVLAASGLLNKKIGGESVKPYQPEGLWIEQGNFSHMLLNFEQDEGDKLYRRSLYTFIRRNVPPPFMATFDAPPRDVCTVQRERTNTPLQALILLNDPQFVEASRILAERIQEEAEQDLGDMLTYAFRLATGRKPSKTEIDVFEKIYHQELERFQNNPEDTKQLLQVGEREADKKFDQAGTAALAMVASTIFNHDEAYMKR